jgi:VWFA-related protein
LFLAASSYAVEPQPSPGFSESTDVVVVEVPVQVLRDGQPVRGLTADDFEVYEGRTRQKVIGFETLDLAAGAGGEKPAATPIAARRHFLMLFDLSFSTPKAIFQARQAASDLVAHLHPSDLVSVATYMSSHGSKVLLGFTGDKQQVLAAFDRIGQPTFLDHKADPLSLVVDLFDELPKPGAAPRSPGPEGGRGQGGIDGTEMEQIVSRDIQRSNLGQKERSVEVMTRSYVDLAKIMSGVRGRKYVVLFSEGFDSSLLTGTTNVDEQNEIAERPVWDIDSDQRFGSSKTTNRLEQMLEEFRRGDCVIEAVDVGGLRTGKRPENQWGGGKDSLFVMARDTGGELFENTNDFGSLVEDLLRRTSVTYVLAVQPEGVKRDGSYHHLRVELKNAPRGARLVHRPGYYAPKPYGQHSPLEKAMLGAEALLDTDAKTGDIRTAVLAAPFAAGDRAYVPVLVEIDGSSLIGSTAKGALPLEIYAYAFDAEGRIRDFFSQTIGLDLAKVGPALQKSGVKFFGHLDLPPGEHSVRVLVRNGATGATGLRVVSVSVPEPGKAEPVLLPAFFPEPTGRWLMVREAPRANDRKVPYPFVAGEEEPYIPASRPALAPGAESRISLVGYHLRPGRLHASARVIAGDGREIGPAEIALVSRAAREADGSERLEGKVRAPAGLPPGEYLLLVTVTDEKGGSQSSAASFEIGETGARG